MFPIPFFRPTSFLLVLQTATDLVNIISFFPCFYIMATPFLHSCYVYREVINKSKVPFLTNGSISLVFTLLSLLWLEE